MKNRRREINQKLQALHIQVICQTVRSYLLHWCIMHVTVFEKHDSGSVKSYFLTVFFVFQIEKLNG